MRKLSRSFWAIASLALTTVTACGVGFDSPSELDGLRVLGVKKSSSYVKPGDEVRLEMLYHDESKQERDVEVMWLSGCKNPPSDLYELCFQFFGEALQDLELPEAAAVGEDAGADSQQLEQLAQLGSQLAQRDIQVGLGREFTLRTDPNILEARPPNPDPRIPPYGLQYVFFAACAGRLQFSQTAGAFPFACFDEDGDVLGADRFVAGYTAVYAYEELTNRNPKVMGFQFKNKGKWEDVPEEAVCVGEDCGILPHDPDRECLNSSPRVDVCQDDEDPFNACPSVEFRLRMDPDVVDENGVISRVEGSSVEEQMWASLHTDEGSLSAEVVLVNDSESGFAEDNSFKYLSSERKGVSHLWAVARDNLGGTDWGRVSVCVH